MTTLNEKYDDGFYLPVGVSGANAGGSGINDITQQINLNTQDLIDGTGTTPGIGLRIAQWRVPGEFITASATFATLGSTYLSPNSTNNILVGMNVDTNIKIDVANEGTIKFRIIPSQAGLATYETLIGNAQGGVINQTSSGTSYNQKVAGYAITNTFNTADAAEGLYQAQMGAGSYQIQFQGIIGGGGSIFMSGTSVDIYYMDNAISGAVLS